MPAAKSTALWVVKSFTGGNLSNKDDKKTNAVQKVTAKKASSSLPAWALSQQLYKNEPSMPPKYEYNFRFSSFTKVKF